MAFFHDFTGIKPQGGYMPIPKGTYLLKIISVKEVVSQKSGRPMVDVDFEVEDAKYLGHKIRFFKVVFMRQGEDGAGLSVHFLKCIGEPHEANQQVNPSQWIGKQVMGQVDIWTDNKGSLWNCVKRVMPIDAEGYNGQERLPF